MHAIDWNPSRSTLRQFAWIGTVFLGLIGCFTTPYLWGLALVCLILGCLWPAGLRPLYLGLFLVTWPIGFVVSNLALALVYFLLITPIAFIFRLSGRDALRRQLGKDEGYWEDRPPAREPRSYYRKY
jgi:hypothetical protein